MINIIHREGGEGNIELIIVDVIIQLLLFIQAINEPRIIISIISKARSFIGLLFPLLYANTILLNECQLVPISFSLA